MQLVAKFKPRGTRIVVHTERNRDIAVYRCVQLIKFIISQFLIRKRRQENGTCSSLLRVFSQIENIACTQSTYPDHYRDPASVLHRDLRQSKAVIPIKIGIVSRGTESTNRIYLSGRQSFDQPRKSAFIDADLVYRSQRKRT